MEGGEARPKKKRDVLFIIIALAIIIIIAGLFLLWFKDKNSKEELVRETEFGGGYEIRDVDAGKVVENQEYGLSLTVPNDWTIKNYGKELGLFSKEVEFDENGAFLKSAEEKKGCIIGISIVKTDTGFLASAIEGIRAGDNFLDTADIKNEIAVVGGKDGLKTTYFEENEQKYSEINIPVGNVMYSFRNGTIFSERCIGEFNNILGTVVINK